MWMDFLSGPGKDSKNPIHCEIPNWNSSFCFSILIIDAGEDNGIDKRIISSRCRVS